MKVNRTVRTKRTIAPILALAWMILIFSMSAQPGEVSGDMSGSISHLFMQIINTIIGCGWNEAELLQLAEQWDYPIRKLAHMTEFGILSLLYLWVTNLYADSRIVSKMVIGIESVIGKTANRHKHIGYYLLALLSTLLYAATDEFHQLFVPGRAGMVTDVMIDSLGAVIALTLWTIVVAIISKVTARKTCNEI